MPSLNQTTCIGTLVEKPKIITGKNGTKIADMRVAIDYFRYDGSGEKIKETVFIDAVVFGRNADSIEKYADKGRQLLLLGRLGQDNWKDKETGSNRSKIKIIVETFQFIDSNGGKNINSSTPVSTITAETAVKEENNVSANTELFDAL